MLLNRIQEWRRITGQVIDHVTKIFTLPCILVFQSVNLHEKH